MKKNQEILEHGSYGRLLRNLCLPCIVVMLVMVIYNMADTFFIGQTGDPNQMAAVSLCAPVFSILSGFGTLFGNGGCTMISIALGEEKRERIKAATGFCLLGAVTVGLLAGIIIFTAANPIAAALGADSATTDFTLTYLRVFALGAPAVLFSGTFCNIIRADGAAVQSMAANMLGTITNIILDAVFILGFHWGVAGAALATNIGNVLTCIYLLVYLTRNELYSLKPKYFFADWKIAPMILYYGLPMACSTLVMSVSAMLSNHLMISYGPTALAAQGVAGKIGMLIGMLAMGICMGLQPAVSFAYGRGSRARIFEIVRKTAVFTFCVGLVLAVTGFIFRSQLVHAFIDNEEVIRYGSVMVFGSLTVGPFVGWYQLTQTFLQATGKSSFATFVALLDKGIFYIPVLLVMAKVFGAYGIAFASPVTTIFSLLAGLLLSIRWYKCWEKDENQVG